MRTLHLCAGHGGGLLASLILSPPDIPDVPDHFIDQAKAELLAEFKEQLENGGKDDEINERAEELMEEAKQAAADERGEYRFEERERDDRSCDP